MRIVQLNTFCGIKSTGRICTEIAKLVEADGGECLIGYGAGTVPKDDERFALRIGNTLERKVYSAARKLLDCEGYGSHAGTRQLIQALKTFQPELIHLHNLHGCYLNLKMLFNYLRQSQLPVLWTLHDCWPFTGHCAYFDYAGCERWQTGCHDCPQLKSYPVCYGLDGSKRNYAFKKKLFTSLENLHFVTPCRWMRKPLGRSFLSHYPIHTIYNGVDLERFHPEESDLRQRYGLTDKRIVLAVASDWDERKGLRYLVDGAQGLGEGYCFVIIGLSETQIGTLPSGMLGIGQTADVNELAAWYTTADCFANPSMEDNMPMVNLEALACGTPVAMFNTGGCPEAIDAQCGLVVQQGDTKALTDAIKALCESKALRQTACLERAAQFDSRHTFQSYVSLYKELCR